MPRLARFMIAALAAIAMMAPGAQAQAPAKPVPCGPYLAEDPKGDAFVGFLGLAQTPVPAGANTDFTALFVRADAGKVTVNMQVADLSKTVPPDASAIVYRMFLDVGDAGNFVQARINPTGDPVYTYGHTGETGIVTDGNAKGALFEGPDGVIQIEVPASHGGKPGTKWEDIYLFSAYVRGAVNTQTDQIPDGDDRKTWNGTSCPEGGTTPEPPANVPTPPGQPPATPPANNPGSGSGAATGPLRIIVTPRKLKAKKVKRSVAFKLNSEEELTNVTATFAKGRKKVGSGKLAKLAGPGKLTVRIKRKLKKGTYKLKFAGRRADGSTGRLTVTIKVS